MARTHRDALAAVVALAIAGFFLYEARLVESSQEDLIGPRLVPSVFAIIAMMLAFLQFVTAFASRTDPPPIAVSADTDVRDELAGFGWVRILLMFAVGAFYIWFFEAVGYIVSSLVVFLLLFFLFGRRNIGAIVLLTIGGTIAYYLIFVKLMGMHDPPGWLLDLSTLKLF